MTLCIVDNKGMVVIQSTTAANLGCVEVRTRYILA